ncbi:hypothetical protein Hanom_Chr09g00841731 [Helianthus anomalus]
MQHLTISTSSPANSPAHQRLLHLQRQLQTLRQINRTRFNPFELLQHLSQPQMNRSYAQCFPRAHPPPSTKRGQPQVRTHYRNIFGQEPVRIEPIGFGPNTLIMGYGPHVHHSSGSSWNHMWAHHSVLGC